MSTYYDRQAPPRPSLASYVLPLALLVVIALLLVWRFWPAGDGRLNPNATLRTVTPAGKLSDAENSQIALYKNTAPSVVNVTNLALMRDRFTLNVERIPKGMGSGFVWDDDGHIVTNFHVVKAADKVMVTLADHSSYMVDRFAVDPDMDLAVLWIGVPRGKLRPIKSDSGRSIRGVIQTTAPINPGNSGGPLLDSSGRLIGVNTAIATESGAWSGIGFAIPADDVNRVVTQLIKKGSAVRPGLGIEPAPDQVARRLGISQGVLILNVYANGPADQAGLQPTRRTTRGIIPGDVILKIDETPIRNTKDLHAVLQGYEVGAEVTVTFQRRDEIREVKMKLQEDPQ